MCCQELHPSQETAKSSSNTNSEQEAQRYTESDIVKVYINMKIDKKKLCVLKAFACYSFVKGANLYQICICFLQLLAFDFL